MRVLTFTGNNEVCLQIFNGRGAVCDVIVSIAMELFIIFGYMDIINIDINISSMNIYQGLTKAWLERDQMALGVFPNCHEYQEIDFQVF